MTKLKITTMRNLFSSFNLWITGVVLLIVWGIGRIVLEVLVKNGNVWVLENMVGIIIGGVISIIGILVLLLLGILRY
jgi:hypothetical protein